MSNRCNKTNIPDITEILFQLTRNMDYVSFEG